MITIRRLANAKDTVSVVVISLDITSKVYPIIYSLDNLPYDCRKLVAMPKPVDGLLIIASNSLLHVSQGSPGVGVAVNGYTKRATDFPGMIYDDKTVALGLALDGAKALVLTGRRLLLFLQNGDWVCVDMRLDGSKVVGMDVKSIRWSQVNSLQKQQQVPLALIPSCVTSVKDGEYFFLGSRVGDSLLVKWSKRQSAENPDHPGKPKRKDNAHTEHDSYLLSVYRHWRLELPSMRSFNQYGTYSGYGCRPC